MKNQSENFINVKTLAELDTAIKLMRQVGWPPAFICDLGFPQVPNWIVYDIARCYDPVPDEERDQITDELFTLAMTPGSAGPIKITDEVKEFLSPMIEDHIADGVADIFKRAGLEGCEGCSLQ